MDITQELKHYFEDFCKEKFQGKEIQANIGNKNRWFFVQAGTKFGDELHYEFYHDEVQLHIEMQHSEELQSYLYQKIENDNFEWRRYWNKPNHSCVLKQQINNFEELKSAFLTIRDKIEPIIMEYENGNDLSLKTCTLRDLFNSENYNLTIPDYQRIYCWKEKNVIRLLEDISNLKEGHPYHLGNIILYGNITRKDNNEDEIKYEIVDGQQRLVTLALILQKLGKNVDLLSQRFESEEAQSYIAYNKFLINNYIDNHTNSFNLDKLLDLLRFSVLKINNGSLDLAYTFFSNQNSRGISLTDYDLLKAHHLRFISTEAQAKHLATRWDKHISTNYDDLSRTFGICLFRLRQWMRKREWNENEKFKVKNEFEAAPVIPDIPPFGEKFYFYESIQGGTHFFAYTDHFIYKYKAFSQTEEYKALKQLDGESHWWYHDVIEGLLFNYYLKFDTTYLSESLVCIARIISQHRYEQSRSSLKYVLIRGRDSEIVMMIDQATSPTFFLAEALNDINRLPKIQDDQKAGIRGRYFEKIESINKEIDKNITIESVRNILNKK